jgi:hypothetical protein
MVDLNSRVPADSSLQLIQSQWIDDDGLIAALAEVTSGPDEGRTAPCCWSPTATAVTGQPARQ